MRNDIYWIWIQFALGYGSRKAIRILEKFETAEDFYKAGFASWKNCELFTLRECLKLKSTSLKQAEQVMADCERYHYAILTPEDDEYPKGLLRIENPPAVLYLRGKYFDIDKEVSLSVVGTREATADGVRCASVLSYRLAQAGAVIVSGTAIGIDSASHRGAMEGQGKTVAVLGHGLHYPYLRKTIPLQEEIAKDGYIITEYRPDEPASKSTFPLRNRILAGLTLGTVVVEAPNRSGALSTANLALEQGKEIFALPGSVMQSNYAGNIKLLQDGARTVYTPLDVLSEYVSEYPHKLDLKNAGIPLGEDNVEFDYKEPPISAPIKDEPKNINEPEKQQPKISADELTDTQRRVYEAFPEKPVCLDDLVVLSGLMVVEVTASMTVLEVNGFVRAVPGGRYEKC